MKGKGKQNKSSVKNGKNIKKVKSDKSKFKSTSVTENIEPIKKKSWFIDTSKDTSKIDEDDKGVLVKFVTKQKEYSITTAAISVNLSSTSTEINNLVQSYLKRVGHADKIPTFEFTINGELLVSTLGRLLTTEGISLEAAVEIEYYEAEPAPLPHESLNHDDWVSCVSCYDNWLLTGCYDNTVHIWEIQKEEASLHKLSLLAHKAPVKDVRWLDNGQTFVSCSMDQKAIVWSLNEDKNKAARIWDCRGHTENISSIDVLSSSKFLTCSWDSNICLWDLEKEFELPTDVPEERKEKLKRTKAPWIKLKGHERAVEGANWVDSTKVVSCSSDHTVAKWDIESQSIIRSITSNVSFMCSAYIKNLGIMLASCLDRHIKIYDMRENPGDDEYVSAKFAPRRLWVSSISLCPNKDNLFVSGCYDQKSYVWDLRSYKSPVFEFEGHKDKVLGVDWSNPKYIASGSADNTAHIYTY